MKVMLINPPRVDGCTVVREERFEHRDIGSCYPPLSLLQTAGEIEAAGYELLFLDANGFNLTNEAVFKKMKEYHPDVVITRIAFDCQPYDYAVIEYAKQECGAITITRCKVIAEAQFVLQQYMQTYPAVDIFLMTEPDAIIVSLLADLKNNASAGDLHTAGIAVRDAAGTLRITKQPEYPEHLDETALPAWHLLPTLQPYHTGVLESPFATVQTSRGCPYGCQFCAYRKNKYRTYSPQRVVNELKRLITVHGLKTFLFFDDVMGLKKGRLENICRLMIEEKLNLKWSCCTRADLLTAEQLKLMKRAGCEEIAFGIESGAEQVLERTRKGVSKDDIRRAAELCRREGVLFYGMCIIGLPGETWDTVHQTITFIKEINPFYTQFCFSTPLPNTPNYHWYKENGYLLTEDWTKYSSLYPEPVVRTEAMSKEDLIEARTVVYRKLVLRFWYLVSKIRIFDWRWNIQGLKKIMERIIAILKKETVR